MDSQIHFYNFLLQVMAVLKFRHPLQNSNKWTIVARASYPQNQGMHQKYDYPLKRTAQKILYELLKFRYCKRATYDLKQGG